MIELSVAKVHLAILIYKKQKGNKNMKILSFIKTVIKNKVYSSIAIVAAVILLAIVVALFSYNGQAKADTDMINALLMKSSELTSAKLNYTGMTQFEDTGISFINKSNFIMIYDATVRAGINIDEVKISANDSKKIIYIDIPKAVVQDVKVDASSIKYFDEKFALFNIDEKEDSNKAIVLAENAAKERAASMGILEYANDQSAALVKGIIEEAIPDGYTIEIRKI